MRGDVTPIGEVGHKHNESAAAFPPEKIAQDGVTAKLYRRSNGDQPHTYCIDVKLPDSPTYQLLQITVAQSGSSEKSVAIMRTLMSEIKDKKLFALTDSKEETKMKAQKRKTQLLTA